jgi:hypothetical protein
VSIQFRDHWFWIDDKDPRSKRALTLLLVLLSFAETGQPPPSPVVTVGAGS